MCVCQCAYWFFQAISFVKSRQNHQKGPHLRLWAHTYMSHTYEILNISFLEKSRKQRRENQCDQKRTKKTLARYFLVSSSLSREPTHLPVHASIQDRAHVREKGASISRGPARIDSCSAELARKKKIRKNELSSPTSSCYFHPYTQFWLTALRL